MNSDQPFFPQQWRHQSKQICHLVSKRFLFRSIKRYVSLLSVRLALEWEASVLCWIEFGRVRENNSNIKIRAHGDMRMLTKGHCEGESTQRG